MGCCTGWLLTCVSTWLTLLASCNFSPQKGQNVKFDSTICSQLGQILFDTLAPHSPQNLCEPVILVPQLSQKTNLPIIFIHGESDKLVPHYMSEEMHKLCPTRKKLVSIKNAGHGVAYLIDPNTYLTELDNFFKDDLK